MKPGDKVRITRDGAVPAWNEIKAGTTGEVANHPVRDWAGTLLVEMTFETFPDMTLMLERLAASGKTLFVDVDALEVLP